MKVSSKGLFGNYSILWAFYSWTILSWNDFPCYEHFVIFVARNLRLSAKLCHTFNWGATCCCCFKWGATWRRQWSTSASCWYSFRHSPYLKVCQVWIEFSLKYDAVQSMDYWEWFSFKYWFEPSIVIAEYGLWRSGSCDCLVVYHV
jgi:hypothetical protein